MILKGNHRKLISVILLGVVLLCACLTAACGNLTAACAKREEKIVLYPEIAAATVTQEYDVKSIISDSNGYEVVLIECYYLDGQMQRVDIPIVDGTKFTPTV